MQYLIQRKDPDLKGRTLYLASLSFDYTIDKTKAFRFHAEGLAYNQKRIGEIVVADY